MYKVLTRQGKNVILGILQSFFNTSPEYIGYNLQWVENTTTTKFWISDRAPDFIRTMPAIVVKAGAGKEMRLSLSNKQQLVTQTVDSVNSRLERSSGKLTVPYLMVVVAKDTITRDRLVDGIIEAVFVYGIQAAAELGMMFYPNTLSVGPDDSFVFDTTTSVERSIVSFSAGLEWVSDKVMTANGKLLTGVELKAIVQKME